MGTHSLCLQKVKPRPPGLRGEEKKFVFPQKGCRGKVGVPLLAEGKYFQEY